MTHSKNLKGAIGYLTRIQKDILEYANPSSGHVLYRINNTTITIAKYNPISAGSYIELAKALQNSMKQIINPQNEDNMCFFYCLAYALYQNEFQTKKYQEFVKNGRLVKNYLDKFDWTDTKFPMNLHDIIIFERKNKIKINVFGYETIKGEEEIINPFIWHLSEQKEYRHEVNLLLV